MGRSAPVVSDGGAAGASGAGSEEDVDDTAAWVERTREGIVDGAEGRGSATTTLGACGAGGDKDEEEDEEEEDDDDTVGPEWVTKLRRGLPAGSGGGLARSRVASNRRLAWGPRSRANPPSRGPG